LRSFKWVALPAQQMPTRSRPLDGICPRHLFNRSSRARTYGMFAGTVARSVWKASGRPQPSEIGRERQQQRDRLAHGAGQMRDRGVDADICNLISLRLVSNPRR
jgi:hypothetical protein